MVPEIFQRLFWDITHLTAAGDRPILSALGSKASGGLLVILGNTRRRITGVADNNSPAVKGCQWLRSPFNPGAYYSEL